MGMFDFIAQGVQPVQLPDPAQQMARAMTLSQLARQNRQGEEDEKFKALDRQSDMLASQGLVRARQGGDIQSVFADLSQQGEVGSLAARKMAKYLAEQEKADSESAYKRAQTGELSAKADRERSQVKLDSLKQFATLGTAIASGQAPVNETTQSAMFEVARSVLPPEIVRTMPADPVKFREWAAVMASPEALAKIAKDTADAGKMQLETQQMPAELAVRQRNAQSSAVSAGAAATNAQTNRLQYTNPNLQHVSDGENGPMAFNPRDGSFKAPPSADGQPRQGKPLTDSQANSTMFGMRAVDMDRTMRDMEEKGYDPTSAGAAWNNANQGKTLTNWMASADGQKYINAGKNFVAATLRKESGAQISESEWADGMQRYIPMPGDSDEVRTQKMRNRELVAKGFRVGAGRGAPEIDKVANERPATKGKAPDAAVRYLMDNNTPEMRKQFQDKYGYLP
jgi:hypothetical protein